MSLSPVYADTHAMTKHIGIVGCSSEGAALCYKSMCLEGAERLGPYAHPEISMHTHSLADYMHCLDRDDLKGVASLMLSSAGKLACAGADVLICPDNTIHAALPFVEPQSPLPWLHIADIVAAEARQRGCKRVGLIGTAWLVNSNVYPEKLEANGIDCLRPTKTELHEIDRLIMTQLVRGIFRPEAVAYFQQVMSRMKNQGCDAVILGCTEIPLLMNDANAPMPMLDSTRLLARAALHHAIKDDTIGKKSQHSSGKYPG